MRNIKLILEYDGTNYCGWQRQKNDITVQQKLEEALLKLTGESIVTTGSSRTDSGVHAKGFVLNFKTECKIPGVKFREALNAKLPADIVVLNSEEVDETFHARYDSSGKTYCYTILNRYIRPTIDRNYVYHVKDKLDVEKMQEACKCFIGKHDFKAFKSQGSSVKTSVRTIKELYIDKDNEYIKIYITADGFLYNMVRIIVGTLLEVGTSKIQPVDINDIIVQGDRTKAGKCVPASGLSLLKVFY